MHVVIVSKNMRHLRRVTQLQIIDVWVRAHIVVPKAVADLTTAVEGVLIMMIVVGAADGCEKDA